MTPYRLGRDALITVPRPYNLFPFSSLLSPTAPRQRIILGVVYLDGILRLSLPLIASPPPPPSAFLLQSYVYSDVYPLCYPLLGYYTFSKRVVTFLPKASCPTSSEAQQRLCLCNNHSVRQRHATPKIPGGNHARR